MTTYTATLTREGDYWVVDVKGIGVTQSRSLREAQIAAVDLIIAATGATAFTVKIVEEAL